MLRKSGRRVIPLTEEQKLMVIDYLDSDLTYTEVADKYNCNVNNLKYWVAKYRRLKEHDINGTKKDN